MGNSLAAEPIAAVPAFMRNDHEVVRPRCERPVDSRSLCNHNSRMT